MTAMQGRLEILVRTGQLVFCGPRLGRKSQKRENRAATSNVYRVSGLRIDFRLFEQGVVPALFFCPTACPIRMGTPRSSRARSSSDDEALEVDEGAGRRKSTADTSRGPEKLASRSRGTCGAPGSDPGTASSALRPHAPGQHREQHDPPDQEIDGDAGRQCPSRVRPARARPACRRSPWDAGTAPACRGRRSSACRRPARARLRP